MKALLFFAALFISCVGFSQPNPPEQKPKARTVPTNAIVIDSSGNQYSAEMWRKLIMTGYYELRPETKSADTRFYLVRVPEEIRLKRLTSSTKPAETDNFTTGEVVKNFSTYDLEGNKIKLKDLKGKIVVLNFWFINCPPCRAEILELNKIVSDYKDSADIVFLGIALDEPRMLETFLKSNPFNYTIIGSGRDIAHQYDIKSYPTHVVIDQEGKAYFHTLGTGSVVLHWIRKSLSELIAK